VASSNSSSTKKKNEDEEKEVKVIIQNGSKGYEPIVLDDIQWQTDRKGSPGKLTLKVIQDEDLNVEEGNAISLKVGKTSVFYGYIFRIARDKTKIISLTCYDQMRYMKNKDTYNFENTTANRIAGMICSDFGIKTGELEETAYVIKYVVYDNKTLMDMVQDALDMTLTNTKQLYVMYDDYGKLTIKQIARMKVGLLIDADTAESFDFESSIDDETYNRIKLMYEDSETHERTVWTAADSGTQQKWGTLQYFESINKDEKESAESKANTLLSLYNTKTKRLTINNVIGDLRVRAGSMVLVQLEMGTEKISNWMVVDSCTHTFKQNEHFMSLKVIGGGYVG